MSSICTWPGGCLQSFLRAPIDPLKTASRKRVVRRHQESSLFLQKSSAERILSASAEQALCSEGRHFSLQCAHGHLLGSRSCVARKAGYSTYRYQRFIYSDHKCVSLKHSPDLSRHPFVNSQVLSLRIHGRFTQHFQTSQELDVLKSNSVPKSTCRFRLAKWMRFSQKYHLASSAFSCNYSNLAI